MFLETVVFQVPLAHSDPLHQNRISGTTYCATFTNISDFDSCKGPVTAMPLCLKVAIDTTQSNGRGYVQQSFIHKSRQ